MELDETITTMQDLLADDIEGRDYEWEQAVLDVVYAGGLDVLVAAAWKYQDLQR